MAIDIDRFSHLRPFSYHVTAKENLASLSTSSVLEPAAVLMRRFGRSDLLRWRRPDPVVLRCDGATVVLKDQAPLIEGNVALYSGWTFEDFVEYLNEHVFFWPGTAEGPIRSGLRLEEHYEATSPLILRIPTTELISANPEAIPLFCGFNSGAPRQRNGRRVSRGPHLFVPAEEFTRRESQVIELAFRCALRLPPTTMFRAGVEWRTLRTRAP